jgi:septum site-determining protein MinD
MVRIIDVCSGKGGVGKTTVVANLGVALQKFNKRVVVIDCNLTTCHLSLTLGMYSNPITLNNFLRNEAKIEDATYVHSSGLRVVPASMDFRDVVNVDASDMKQKLKSSFSNYDFVFLDSAPSLGKESLISLQASDEVLFVANPNVPSLVDVVRCNQLISMLDEKPTPIGIVMNMVRNKPYEIKTEEVKQFTSLPVIGVVPEDEKILECANKKTLSIISKPKCSSSRAFFEIAAKISGFEYNNGMRYLIKKLWRF